MWRRTEAAASRCPLPDAVRHRQVDRSLARCVCAFQTHAVHIPSSLAAARSRQLAAAPSGPLGLSGLPSRNGHSKHLIASSFGAPASSTSGSAAAATTATWCHVPQACGEATPSEAGCSLACCADRSARCALSRGFQLPSAFARHSFAVQVHTQQCKWHTPWVVLPT